MSGNRKAKNMKRYVVLALIAVFCLCCLWGCGKKKKEEIKEEVTLAPLTEVKLQSPNEVAPQAETSNSVGLMAFYPNNNDNMAALAGTNTFTVYFENKGITLGSGKIGIYEADSNAIYATRDASESAYFEIGQMDEIGTALTGWTEGTKIDVYFNKIFLPNSSYYVLIDGGFFKLGTVQSGAVTNASLITFKTKPYGVDTTNLNLSKTYSVNDLAVLNVLCDGQQATMFAFKEYDTQFLEITPLNGTSDTISSVKFLKGGNPSVTVAFYNAGHEVDSLSFTFNVAGDNIAADDSEESGRADASEGASN